MVRALITTDVIRKLESVERIPRKERRKRNVPAYYGGWITRYTETAEFQLRQKESEHRTLMAQRDAELRAAKADASNAKFHLALKNAQLESLRKQLEELKGSKAA